MKRWHGGLTHAISQSVGIIFLSHYVAALIEFQTKSSSSTAIAKNCSCSLRIRKKLYSWKEKSNFYLRDKVFSTASQVWCDRDRATQKNHVLCCQKYTTFIRSGWNMIEKSCIWRQTLPNYWQNQGFLYHKRFAKIIAMKVKVSKIGSYRLLTKGR